MSGSVDSDAGLRGGSREASADIAPPDAPVAGLYRHYKGARYQVIDCVRHSETEEHLVLYRALYGARGLWVRPLAMFVGTVRQAGADVPRFALVQADTDTR